MEKFGLDTTTVTSGSAESGSSGPEFESSYLTAGKTLNMHLPKQEHLTTITHFIRL
jgi:hypothetical protein